MSRSNDVADLDNLENGFTVTPCLSSAEGYLLLLYPNIAPAIPLMYLSLRSTEESLEMSPTGDGGFEFRAPAPISEGDVTITEEHKPLYYPADTDWQWFVCTIPISSECTDDIQVTWDVPFFIPAESSMGDVSNLYETISHGILTMINSSLSVWASGSPVTFESSFAPRSVLAYLSSVASVDSDVEHPFTYAEEGKENATNAILAGYTSVEDIIQKGFGIANNENAACGQSLIYVESDGGVPQRAYTSRELTSNIVKEITVIGSDRAPNVYATLSFAVEGDLQTPAWLTNGATITEAPELSAFDVLVVSGDVFPSTGITPWETTDNSVMPVPTGITLYDQRPPSVFFGEFMLQGVNVIYNPFSPEGYTSLLMSFSGHTSIVTRCFCQDGVIGDYKCPECLDQKFIPCPLCSGTQPSPAALRYPTAPVAGSELCPMCGGDRVITCPSCHGEGGVVGTPCPTCSGAGVAYRQELPDTPVQKIAVAGSSYDEYHHVRLITLTKPLSPGKTFSIMRTRDGGEELIPHTVTTKYKGDVQTVAKINDTTISIHLSVLDYGAQPWELSVYTFSQDAETTADTGFLYTTNPAELIPIEGAGIAEVGDFYATGGSKPITMPPGLSTLDIRQGYKMETELADFLNEEGFTDLYNASKVYQSSVTHALEKIAPLLPWEIETLITPSLDNAIVAITEYGEPLDVNEAIAAAEGNPILLTKLGVYQAVNPSRYYRAQVVPTATRIEPHPEAHDRETKLGSLATTATMRPLSGDRINLYAPLLSFNPFTDGTQPTIGSLLARGFTAALGVSQDGSYVNTLLDSANKGLRALTAALDELTSYTIPELVGSTLRINGTPLDNIVVTSTDGPEEYLTMLSLSDDAKNVNPEADPPDRISTLYQELTRIVDCASRLATTYLEEDGDNLLLVAKTGSTHRWIAVSKDSLKVGYQGHNLVKLLRLFGSLCSLTAYVAALHVKLIRARFGTALPFVYYPGISDGSLKELELPLDLALFSAGTTPVYPKVNGTMIINSNAPLIAGQRTLIGEEDGLYYEIRGKIPATDTATLQCAPLLTGPGVWKRSQENDLPHYSFAYASGEVFSKEPMARIIADVNRAVNDATAITKQYITADAFFYDRSSKQFTSVPVIDQGLPAQKPVLLEEYRQALQTTVPASPGVLKERKFSIKLSTDSIIPYRDASRTLITASIEADIDFRSGKPDAISATDLDSLAALAINQAIVTNPTEAEEVIKASGERIINFLLNESVIEALRYTSANRVQIAFAGFADPVLGSNQGESALALFATGNTTLIQSYESAIAGAIAAVGWKTEESGYQYNLALSQRRAAVIAAAIIKYVKDTIESKSKGRLVMGVGASVEGALYPFRCYGFGGAFSPATIYDRDKLRPFRQTAVSLIGPLDADKVSTAAMSIGFKDSKLGLILPLRNTGAAAGCITGDVPITNINPGKGVSVAYGKGTAEQYRSWYMNHFDSLNALVGNNLSAGNVSSHILSLASGGKQNIIQPLIQFVSRNIESFLIRDSGTELFSTVYIKVVR